MSIYNPLISVVVPIYNVEPYLEECLESLHKQTYQFLEILLIDDGSTDGSAKICNKYVLMDERFHYYYKENSGLSGARNYAIGILKGDYVAFVDSDDKIAPNTYNILASKLLQKNYDIIQFGYHNGILEDSPKLMLNEGELSSRDALISFLLYGPDVVWNKLVSREIVSKCLFKEGIMKEDSYVMPSFYLRANKILNISDCLYFYRTREGSIMNRPFSRNFYDTMTVYENIMRVTKDDMELYSIAAARSVVAMANLYSQFIQDKNFTDLDKIVVKFKGKEYLDVYNKVKSYSRIKFSYKLQILLFSISPFICSIVLHIQKRLA